MILRRKIIAQSSQYLGFPLTKDQPLTSHTYDFPSALNRSNPQMSCSNYCTIFEHKNFSYGVKITGNLFSFPLSSRSTTPSKVGDLRA